MLVTNLVLRTQPGRARSVADLVGQLHGMHGLCVEGDHHVLATWQVPEGQNPEPEGLSEVLRAMSEEILEVALVDEQDSGDD
jgi:hypothetical protein